MFIIHNSFDVGSIKRVETNSGSLLLCLYLIPMFSLCILNSNSSLIIYIIFFQLYCSSILLFTLSFNFQDILFLVSLFSFGGTVIIMFVTLFPIFFILFVTVFLYAHDRWSFLWILYMS